MKKLLGFCLCATLLFLAGCSEEYDDSTLVGRVDDLENRVTRIEELCKQMNTNISSLQTIVAALQNKDYITDVTPFVEYGETKGYIVTFTKANPITIYHGKDGVDGKDGINGKDGVDGKDGINGKDGVDGKDGINGKDGVDGKDGINGKDGADGKDGIDGKDGVDGKDGINGKDGADGKDGIDGKDGTDGKDGYTPQIGVKLDSTGIYYWTLDGEWLLDEDGNRIKAVGTDGKDGADGKDGVDGKDGINGKDGADGKDGIDGKDGVDGKDGINGKDGADGKDGIDGKDGVDGKDGITPLLKIENDYWYISSDNGITWTRLGRATGIDGKDGDSFFQSVTQDEKSVYFTLSDGSVITIPKGVALGIAFDEEDLIVMSPNSTRSIGYTVTSAITPVTVEVTSSADIKAKVTDNEDGGLAGKIQVTTGSTIDEYSKVIVFVSNGDRVIMRSITFEEAGLEVEDNAVKNAAAEGGEMTLEFLSNVRCEVVIPEEAQDWISIAPTTRAMVKQSITLLLEPNTGYYRSATVTVQSPDGNLKLEYKIEQDGDKGVYIDPTKIPDNEIWYVTKLGKDGYVDHLDPVAFGANIVEQVYEKGMWVVRFDKELKSIKWLSLINFGDTITELYLPNSLEHLGNMTVEIKEFYVPKNLKSIFMPEVLFGDKLERFYGDKVSEDGRCIVVDNKLLAFAPAGLKEYTIPEGITTIGQQAVRSNELKTITIPEGVSILEDEAFMRCPNIEYINLPSSLTEIGGYAFFQLKNLKKISGNSKFISDDGYSLIIDNYFQGKTFLTNFASGADITSYEIPEGVNGIDSYAFYKAESLKELSFPSTLTDIASEYSFLGTYNIEKIYGPNVLDDNRSLVVDGTLLYVAPKGLVEYTTPKGATKISFGGLAQKPELESIVISDDVLAVGDALSCRPYEIPVGYILWNNPNLKTVTISANIKILGMDPFGTGGGSKREASLNIETVYLRAPIPPVIGHNFPDEIPSLFPNLTIYVPEQSLEAYLGSPDWAPYRGYIKGYNYTDLPENDTYISSDYSKDGVVTTLQTATKGEGIDIVLMGDAYSDRQIADGSYKADMENLYNNLFTEEPYKSFKDHFNVYYVNVVSATEGYEYGNTALDGYFGDGTLVGGNDNAVFNYALKAISEEEMDEALIVVAMNSDNYAGTCYMYNPDNSAGYGNGVSVSYFPRGGNAETFAQLLHHEACGHGFAKLADEYAYEYNGTIPEGEALDYMNKQKNWGWWKNVDFTSDLSQVRWKHFLNDSRYQYDGLGAYEGGLTYWTGVWRPTENSIMRHNTGGFNAPSREAIYYRIHKLAYGDSWEYDYEEFAEWDAKNRNASAEAAARSKARKPANYKPTHPPVIINKSWRDAK